MAKNADQAHEGQAGAAGKPVVLSAEVGQALDRTSLSPASWLSQECMCEVEGGIITSTPSHVVLR